MMNRQYLIDEARQHAIKAFFAGTDEVHLNGINNHERIWTEWCSLEDVDVVGDTELHKMEARPCITWSFTEYGNEMCPFCYENAHAYYDDMILGCPHCGRKIEVELGENGNEIFTLVGEYNPDEGVGRA